MKLLKFNLNIPFWCSFTEYGTMNIQQTYPFPPPPTIFGMILNALGKPAVHTIDNDNAKKKLIEEYLQSYSKLKFSIIVKETGEKINDYLNILKGNRDKESSRSALNDKLSKEIKKLKKENESASESEIKNKISEYTSDFWKKQVENYGRYRIDKKWMKTQVNRQRLIQPKYVIYIQSSDEYGEYSLENMSSCLKNPQRPLYIGESDDLVEICMEKKGIVQIENEKNKSSQISSVLPGLYQNSLLVKIPIRLRYDKTEKQKLLCSIPIGDVKEKVSCLKVAGENIVFL